MTTMTQSRLTTVREPGYCYQCGRETTIARHSITSPEHFAPQPEPFRSVMFDALNAGAESLGMSSADFTRAVFREFSRVL